MALRDLLRRMPQGALDAAKGSGVLRRVVSALATPPSPNRYVAPRVRTLDAVAFALRGYRVFWTAPTPYEAPDGGQPNPSVLVYALHAAGDADDPEGVDWCAELPTLVPGEVHRAASWLEGARTIGWRFAWWQVQREAQWVLQRRGMRKAKRSGR